MNTTWFRLTCDAGTFPMTLTLSYAYDREPRWSNHR